MTPEEIAAEASLRLRFQTEVAYLDRPQPSEGEVSDDTELLDSTDGLLVVAWLWPWAMYGNDPFVVAQHLNEARRGRIAVLRSSGDVEEVLAAASRTIDRQRERQRRVVADRFVRIVEATARAVGHSVEDVKAHLEWSVPLTELELDRLLHANSPFPFRLIPQICSALQLDFVDEFWVMIDPGDLVRRIEQSVVANQIAEYLRTLGPDDLARVGRRLPRRSADAEQAQQQLEVYSAPARDGRYGSLYEALAADDREAPLYSLDEIDRVLIDAGEMPLPESARSDRSWWAGTGAKTEGRPQVGAWWAAGYRIRRVEFDSSSRRVLAVGFEALPGRAEWLTDSERTTLREYRLPGPIQVPIYPADARALDAMRAALSTFADAARQLGERIDAEGIRAGIEPLAAALDHLKDLKHADADAGRAPEARAPEDPDIRRLVGFLEEVGEASRSQILDHFSEIRDRPVADAWMTNLLTKARRQGWTINKGTRSQPRWALGGECPVCGNKTLQPYSTDRLKCSSCGVVLSEDNWPAVARSAQVRSASLTSGLP